MLSDAKPILQSNINEILYNSLYKAFMSTFSESDISDSSINKRAKQEIDDAAKQFAKTCADEASKNLAESIYEFVKKIGIVAKPTGLVSPQGPVSGIINLTDFSIY